MKPNPARRLSPRIQHVLRKHGGQPREKLYTSLVAMKTLFEQLAPEHVKRPIAKDTIRQQLRLRSLSESDNRLPINVIRQLFSACQRQNQFIQETSRPLLLKARAKEVGNAARLYQQHLRNVTPFADVSVSESFAKEMEWLNRLVLKQLLKPHQRVALRRAHQSTQERLSVNWRHRRHLYHHRN